jgi:hypothetical protein
VSLVVGLLLIVGLIINFDHLNESVQVWSLKSTDLSGLSINELKIGDTLSTADLENLGTETQEATVMNKSGDSRHFFPDFIVTLNNEGEVIDLIAFLMSNSDTFLFTYPDIKSIEDVTSLLGADYIKVPFDREQSTEALLFVDKANNLKFRAVYRTFAPEDILFLVLERK